MKNVNSNNENYFKSMWFPFMVSVGFSIVQATDISFKNLFFDVDYIQLIDTFVVCIYATILPVWLVDFVDSEKPLPIKYTMILLCGVAFYMLYSFTGRYFIVLLLSLLLSIISFFKFKKHLNNN